GGGIRGGCRPHLVSGNLKKGPQKGRGAGARRKARRQVPLGSSLPNGHSPATAALFLRNKGGRGFRSKETGLVFEPAVCDLRLVRCVRRSDRRAGVPSRHARGAACQR